MNPNAQIESSQAHLLINSTEDFDNESEFAEEKAKPISFHSPMRLLLSKVVVYWILFLSEAARGVLLPSQAEYIQELGGGDLFLGFTV